MSDAFTKHNPSGPETW